MTYIGLGADKVTYTGRSTNTALHLRDNAGGRFYNSAILDFGGAETLIEGATLPGAGNAANTSGQRSEFAYTLSAFNQGPASAFELEYQDNDLWCIGRQEDLGVPLTLPTGDSTTYGGDAGKNHWDNGFYTNAALDNTYLGCDPNSLPIRALVRTDSGDTARPDQVTTLDPRPKVGSPLLTTDRTPPTDGFFMPAPVQGCVLQRRVLGLWVDQPGAARGRSGMQRLGRARAERGPGRASGHCSIPWLPADQSRESTTSRGSGRWEHR